MKCFRYDIISAGLDYGVKIHPQDDMRSLGFSVTKSEAFPIGDCWYFLSERYPDILPEYIHEVSYAPFSSGVWRSCDWDIDAEERRVKERMYRMEHPAIWKEDGTLTDAGRYYKEHGGWKSVFDKEKQKHTVGYYGEDGQESEQDD